MAYSKRQFQSYRKPLRVLLKEIDQAADAYARNGYREVVGENFLRTPPSLYELLDELMKYHPLNFFVTLHGKKVLEKVHHDGANAFASEWLETKIRTAFQLRGHSNKRGALGRDAVRIAKSFARPFEGLVAVITDLIVIIKEMGRK